MRRYVMENKIIFVIFSFITMVNFGILGFILWVILVVFIGLCPNKKSEMEKILDTYKVIDYSQEEENNKGELISSPTIGLKEKLNTLSNKNGAIQLNKLTALTENFEDIISYQIDVDQPTVIEYRSAVDQVYQAVLSNLDHYFLVIKSVEPINNKMMYEASLYSQKEKKSLSDKWLDLSSKQKNHAKNILIKNEQAITQLYVFITDVVNISFNKMPANRMKKALERLAAQTKKTEQYADVLLTPTNQYNSKWI